MKDDRVQIVVRTTIEEREAIKEKAAKKELSMNQFILDSIFDSANDSTASTLDSTIFSVLETQLESKDKQIDKLQTLVDQQQQLTLQSNQQIHQLQLEATKQTEEQPNQTTPGPVQAEKTESNPPPVKKSFFSRFFEK